MPQARRSGSGAASGRSTRSSSGAGSSGAGSSGRSTSKRAASSSSKRSTASRAKPKAAASSAGAVAGGATAAADQAKAAAAAAEQRAEAVAQRLRKLNERIIAAGRDAGETTLTSYEKALKAIATSIEKGPGSSDIDWISTLATTQAKFIRDVTTAWTNAARDMLTK